MEDGSPPPDRGVVPAEVLQPDADVSALGTQAKRVDININDRFVNSLVDIEISREESYCVGISDDVSFSDNI